MTFVPIRDAVIIAQTNAAHIRQRAHRGKIETETADDGSVLYSIPDLVRLEKANRDRKRRADERKRGVA